MNKIKFTKRGRNKAINVLLILSLAACFLIPFNLKADDTSPIIKHFTINCYGIFDTTPQIYAGLYDMTVADGAANVVAGIAQVKVIEPSFKALYYWNMRVAQSGGGFQPVWDACVANNWFLRDSGGNIIHTDVGYLIDFGNSAYQAWIANWLKNKIDSYGYDGLYGDNNLSWGAGDYFWAAEATPINPRTGNPWTDVEVRAALIAYHKAVKNALGSRLYCANGVFTGSKFYSHQAGYEQVISASPANAIMSESLWYPTYGQWMSETQWQQSIDFLTWVQDNWLSGYSNKFYVPVVKMARGTQEHTPLPSGCTLKQMATYAYASTLLGIKSAITAQNYFSTYLSTADLQTIGMKQLLDAQVGSPTSNYYIISGTHVYARNFSNGIVLVNPTSTNYAITLPSNTYWTYDGTPVTTLTVQPHTGTILLKQSFTVIEPPALVVRGTNNLVYYRTYGISTDSWTYWAALPGATCDSPAAAICNNELHMVVRDLSGSTLYHGYVNLATNAFLGWTALSGSTPSVPTLTSNGTVLSLVVRGGDNRIYYRTYSFSPRSWGSLNALPTGTTGDSPTAAMLGNKLHIVVRGSDGNTLYHIIGQQNVGVVRNWISVSGTTPSKPTLTANLTANKLYLAVRGSDNRIYWRPYVGATDSWAGWNTVPIGTTPDAPAATIADNKLQIVVRDMSGTALYHGNVDLGTSAFSGWTLLSGSTPSAPSLTS